MTENSFFVHESSYVDQSGVIGKNTKIWHFCHIMKDVQIGENCILGQNVFVGPKVKIGNSVKIQNNVSVYQGVECEDDVFLGPSMVFTNVVNPRSSINRKEEFKKTIVRKGATIGANATILCGIEVGRYAFIGAGAVVTGDVPDFALITGVPGRVSGWMSETGLKLSFNEEGIAICKEEDKKYTFFDNKVVQGE